MYRLPRFLAASALLTALLTITATAQSPTATPPPISTASPPAYVAPKGTGFITGRVVYEGGQPVAGVGVVAAIQNRSWLILNMPYISQRAQPLKELGGKMGMFYSGPLAPGNDKVEWVNTVTAAAGTYRLSVVTTAAYNIFVTAPHQSRWAQMDKPSEWVAVADEGVTAQEGQMVTAPDLVLTRGAVIQGRVLEIATGSPLPGIIVKAHGPARPASSGATLTTITDNAGRYVLRVAPGKSEMNIDGVRLATGEEHDGSMKINDALWSMENQFVAVVDGGTSMTKSSPVDTVPVTTEAGQTHTVMFKLRRGKLQYRLASP